MSYSTVRRLRWTILCAASSGAVLTPKIALAGMPAVGFSDVARLRLEAISFFAVVILLSAGAVYALWNWLRADFIRLPRLSYGKAVGIVVLWGLLFVVVLTMISGARELMTPGAWERDGATYKLRDEAASQVEVAIDPAQRRRNKLGQLYGTLTTFAATHDGRFPTDDELSRFPSELLQVDGAPGVKIAYIRPATDSAEPKIVAFESVVYGDDPLALFTDGEIRAVPFDEIAGKMPEELPQ